MPRIGAKEVFDTSVIGGFIVAVIFEYIWNYIANAFAALKNAIWGTFTYKDLLTLIVHLILAWLTKGTLRKLFIYAFWFKVAFEVVQAFPISK
jgi:hypothetical protein